MEMNSANKLEKPKYLAATTAALLVTAFVLVQPAMQTAYAVGIEGLPDYDNCNDQSAADDPISQITLRNKHIVKTVHAEKEIYHCFLTQGNLPVIVDLTTYLEVTVNITSQEVLRTSAFATTCLKDGPGEDTATATVMDCESSDVGISPVFVGSVCEEESTLDHPQEMTAANKGKLGVIIESQKEVFKCDLIDNFPEEVEKKVDIVLFTIVYQDLNTGDKTVKFWEARCVVLNNDIDGDNDIRDATVESCIFDEIPN